MHIQVFTKLLFLKPYFLFTLCLLNLSEATRMNASFFKKHRLDRLDYISPPPALKGHSKDFALTSKEWSFVTLFSFVG